MNTTSEIFQNTSADGEETRRIMYTQEGDAIIVMEKKSGDLVTCNLSSLNYARMFDKSPDGYEVFTDEWQKWFESIVKIQARLLDNVITLNRAVVDQAIATNHKYRAIGAGIFGILEYATSNGYKWDSEAMTNEVYGKLPKYHLKAMIKASHELGLEKGSYPQFQGSDWNNGDFFKLRGFEGEEWDEYRKMASVAMRNGYLMAVAPTSANAIICGTSPSVDNLYEVTYREKKDGLSYVYVPANYNNKTKWFYSSAFDNDEMWATVHIGAMAKYVDQGISHNMHVSSDIKGSELLRLHLGNWKHGNKSSYYLYTRNGELPSNCVMCEG